MYKGVAQKGGKKRFKRVDWKVGGNFFLRCISAYQRVVASYASTQEIVLHE